MNTSAIWYCCCLMTESLKMKIWSSSHVGTVLYRLRGQSMSYRFYCAVTAPRWSDCPTVQHQSGAFINYTSWLGSSITSALVFTSIYCRSRTAVHSLANESSRCGCFSKKYRFKRSTCDSCARDRRCLQAEDQIFHVEVVQREREKGWLCWNINDGLDVMDTV